MKNSVIVIFFFISGIINAQSAADRVIFHYLKLSKALSQSDYNKASRQATLMAKECGSSELAMLKNTASAMAQTTDLALLREKFSPFSDSLVQAMKSGKLKPSEELFLVYCPMAFNDKGANWISDEPKVVNPYFGDEMLHCGSVKQKLKKVSK